MEVGRLGWKEGGHGSAVASVCFPGFGLCEAKGSSLQVTSKSLLNGTMDDRLMITAGNDCNVLVWDLGANMVGNDAVDPALYLSRGGAIERGVDDSLTDIATDLDDMIIDNSSVKKKGKGGKPNDEAKNSSDDDLIPSPPKVLFQIPHRHKPNWITCSRASDTVLPCSLFVADITNDISIYTLQI